jgi:hypothetical protein
MATSETELLSELLQMPPEKRISAVAKDVRTRKDRYRSISAHDLAEALEVPQPDSPSTYNKWGFTRFAKKQTLEEYAKEDRTVSEFVCHLKGRVSDARFKELEQQFRKLGDVAKPKFGVLTKRERRQLESCLAEEELDVLGQNGLNCLAEYEVRAGRNKLRFQGEIEDDGTCWCLRTPYDERDGGFFDYTDYVTVNWG